MPTATRNDSVAPNTSLVSLRVPGTAHTASPALSPKRIAEAESVDAIVARISAIDDELVTVEDHRSRPATTNFRPIKVEPLLVRLAPGKMRTSVVEVLQQWEGLVDSRDATSVCARLFDLNDVHRAVDYVQLEVDEFPASERRSVVPGEVFYWTIGYERRPGGGIRRISELRLRRTPPLTRSALDRIDATATKLSEQFGLNP